MKLEHVENLQNRIIIIISQKGTAVTISINSLNFFEIVISAEFIQYEGTYILLWKTSLMFTLMEPKTANISKAKKSENFCSQIIDILFLLKDFFAMMQVIDDHSRLKNGKNCNQ